MSRRLERVASLIRTILASAIRTRLSDPRIEPISSITRVDVSADFSVAHVYVSVLAPEPRQRLTLRALRAAAGRLRGLLSEALVLRQCPAIDFRLDDSIKKSGQTIDALDRVRQTPAVDAPGATGANDAQAEDS